MVTPDRRLGDLVASLNKWRFAGFVTVYLAIVPAAIIAIAIAAQSGLHNDRRQDKVLRAQAVADRKLAIQNRELARQNCERSYALLNYFLAANTISTNAGSPYAPLIRPELNRLIDTFNSLDGCAPKKPTS